MNATFDDGSVLTGSVDFDASKFSTDQWSNASFSLVGGDHFLRSFDVVDSLGGNISPAGFTIGLGNFAIDNGTDPITTTSRVNLTFLIDPSNIKGSNDGLVNFWSAALFTGSAIQRFHCYWPWQSAITETNLTVGAICGRSRTLDVGNDASGHLRTWLPCSPPEVCSGPV